MEPTRSGLTTIAARPLIHPILAPFPSVCFVGALCTDLAYWGTADMQWADFSIWLLTAGLVTAGFAGLAVLVDLVRSRRPRASRPAWLRVVGSLMAIALSLVNAFVHSRDAYTSVVPTGLALSALVVAIIVVTGCMRWSLVQPITFAEVAR